MHVDLLGYLLGALEADEQERVERALAADPRLRSELNRLRRNLEPLEAIRDQQDPPPGLVDRVCAAVEQHDRQPRPVPVDHDELAAGSASVGWSLADLLVLALVALIAFTLFLPALAGSRYVARRMGCAENLRMLGVQLISFSDRDAGHQFPFVPPEGKRSFAGIFGPTLLDNQLITRHCNWLICPGSELGEHGDAWYVPSLRQIEQAEGNQLTRLRAQAGGSYAYCIGYFDESGYRGNRNAGRSFFALVADAPSDHLPGRVSANHGGRGQNICFEDGHVEFITDPRAMARDDPLRNRLGFVRAGVHRNDAVLLNSAMQPKVERALVPLPWSEDDRQGALR